MKTISKTITLAFLSIFLFCILPGCENFIDAEDDYDYYDDSWADDYQGWDAALYTELTVTYLTLSTQNSSGIPRLDLNIKNTGDAVCKSVEAYAVIKKENRIINNGTAAVGDIPVNYNSSTSVIFSKSISYNTSYTVEVILSWYNVDGDYFETVVHL
ncbi:MAG: hypothetical protein K8H86_04755 [Ignavibacteriaceae bacterium]|nr:hypothetical protein [Ignavibacteriaceae bacterium]